MLHIVITGSRPAKDKATNRYLPIPEENVQFITSTLDLLKAQPFTLYVGDAKGVDATARAHVANLLGPLSFEHIHTFPAYWNGPNGSFDKAAGLTRNHHMIDVAIRDAKVTNGKVITLAFYATHPSNGTDDAVKYSQSKNVTVHAYDLPVSHEQQFVNWKQEHTITENAHPAPDPFANGAKVPTSQDAALIPPTF